MALRIAIVDDEELARLRLRTLVAALPGGEEAAVEVVGEAGDAESALALLARVPADAVLLDIAMPGPGAHPGLQLAAALAALPRPPAVVFVTAHAEHALAAFETDAVDYLTKPVRLERLSAALQRVRQWLASSAFAPLSAPMGLPEPPALVFADRGRLLRIPVDELLYLRAELKYVTLRTAAREHLVDEPLAEIERRLAAAGGDFLRIHRNALVARRAVRALELRPGSGEGGSVGGEGWAVRVAPVDEWLAVSRRQVAAVREALAAARGG